MSQPLALQIALFCDGNIIYAPAAAELRRQHEEIERLSADCQSLAEQLHVALNAPAVQLRDIEARYRSLLKSVADGEAMRPRQIVIHCGTDAADLRAALSALQGDNRA